jgi:hypothetical protein
VRDDAKLQFARKRDMETSAGTSRYWAGIVSLMTRGGSVHREISFRADTQKDAKQTGCGIVVA